jgi:hypothetical protein
VGELSSIYVVERGNDTWGTFYRPPADFFNKKKNKNLIKSNF